MTDEEWLEAQGFQEVISPVSQWREWRTPEMHVYLSLTATHNPKWIAYVADHLIPAGEVRLATEGNTPADAIALLSRSRW